MSRPARTTRAQTQATLAQLKARLNLYAVLQNLEELVRLDEQASEIVRQWSVSVRLGVRRGPSVRLRFADGRCRHERGARGTADVSLYCLSPQHLNAMFEGRAIPIPLKGFRRLGWLRKDFRRLTDRLEFYLRSEDLLSDTASERLRTTLVLQTAVFASAELAALDPSCRQIAARMPDGILQVHVMPDGAAVQVTVSGGEFQVVKGFPGHATARMAFSDIGVAAAILGGRLDSFQAIADSRLKLAGNVGMIDDFSLILDRVEDYLL